MAKVKQVQLRRKREGRTNYKKRLKLLKSGKKRLVVRRSLRNITAQLIEYSPAGDRIIAAATSIELKKYGYIFNTGNIVGAYLTGLLLGARAKKKGVNEAILDLGLHTSTKSSRIYSVVKGAIDAGLKVPCSQDTLPKDDRIKGTHIKNYADKIKKEGEKYKRQFSSYIKNNASPDKIGENFEEAKKNIIKG